jgi:methyl-accepting chemotaxis protein
MNLIFGRAAPRILIVITVLVIVTLAFLSNRLFRNLTSAVEQNQFDLMKTIIRSSLRAAEDRAMARAEMIANLPSVRDTFAKRDRERLLAECGPMFDIQKAKYGVDQMQFHVPPAVSFLRLHAPTQHSDDLTKFRPLVVAVNTDRVARKGLVIARTGPAIFGVVPMTDPAGAHSGTLDVGMDFNPILDGLKATYQLELALFIAEEPLRKFATGLSGDVLAEENRRGKFIKFHSTHWALMKDLASETDVINVTEEGYTRELRGVTYGVLTMPLRDPGGEPLGLLAVAKDFSASRAAAGRSLVWQSLLALFAIVALAVAIIVVIRGFLLRPIQMINERFASLAKGDRSCPIDQPETLCQEMQDLAASYEQLRTADEKRVK